MTKSVSDDVEYPESTVSFLGNELDRLGAQSIIPSTAGLRGSNTVSSTTSSGDRFQSITSHSRRHNIISLVSRLAIGAGVHNRHIRRGKLVLPQLGRNDNSWRELWTADEQDSIIDWQDRGNVYYDYWGDVRVCRAVKLEEAEWVKAAIAFGRNIAENDFRASALVRTVQLPIHGSSGRRSDRIPPWPSTRH